MSWSNFVLRLSAIFGLIVLFTVPMSTAYDRIIGNTNTGGRNNTKQQ